MAITVAIVGSGPAGFYTAEALLKRLEDGVRVAIIDRLPTPYGLIRAGVAPDHQTTKKVMRAFERTASDSRVAYLGNVDVGRDISVAELQSRFDAVVLATGAPFDRPLGIPGEDKAGVYGSAAFVGWYNGHPDFCDLNPDLDVEAAVVIGNGNVAVDVARVLVKTPEEMASSDLPDYAGDAIQRSPIRDVYLVGRRGPLEAKFTNVELREMGKLEDCLPIVDRAVLPETVEGLEDDRDRRLKERNLATLREFCEIAPGNQRKRVHFVFFAQPLEILGGARAEAVRFEKTRLEKGRIVGTGEILEIACGMVVPAIGYRSQPVDKVPFDAKSGIFVSDAGRIAEGLYAVGWAMRGPSGVIASNRPDGVAITERIANEVKSGSKPGVDGLAAALRERGVRPVDFSGWKHIEAAEIARAKPPAPRCKFSRIADMLAVIDKTS